MCYAEGMGLLAVKTGTEEDETSFTIYSVDRFGNKLDRGGDPWEVSFIGSETIEPKIEDNRQIIRPTLNTKP